MGWTNEPSHPRVPWYKILSLPTYKGDGQTNQATHECLVKNLTLPTYKGDEGTNQTTNECLGNRKLDST